MAIGFLLAIVICSCLYAATVFLFLLFRMTRNLLMPKKTLATFLSKLNLSQSDVQVDGSIMLWKQDVQQFAKGIDIEFSSVFLI